VQYAAVTILIIFVPTLLTFPRAVTTTGPDDSEELPRVLCSQLPSLSFLLSCFSRLLSLRFPCFFSPSYHPSAYIPVPVVGMISVAAARSPLKRLAVLFLKRFLLPPSSSLAPQAARTSFLTPLSLFAISLCVLLCETMSLFPDTLSAMCSSFHSSPLYIYRITSISYNLSPFFKVRSHTLGARQHSLCSKGRPIPSAKAAPMLSPSVIGRNLA
jgi:hypothetical protein